MQFDIKFLLLITTLAAVFFAVWTAFSSAPPFSRFCLAAAVTGLVATGVEAYKAGKSFPFWQCISAMTLSLLLPAQVSSRYGDMSYESAVTRAGLLGIAVVLAFSAIRNGHWATKIAALFVFIPFSLLIFAIIMVGISNWPDVWRYWTG